MYSYAYDGEGNLYRVVDHLRNITAIYYYDLINRLVRSTASDGTQYRYEYDLNKNLTKFHQTAAGSSWTTEYTYDEDNRPVTAKVGTRTITDHYNATDTIASRVYGSRMPYTVALTYLAGVNGSKTGMLASYRNGSDTAYTYAYDNNGNITSITKGSTSATYTYDSFNQLTRVNDGFANKTTTYSYDHGGNITTKREYAYTTGTLGTPLATVAYTYDAAWKDKLVSYNGQSITYDEIGNPLTYRGYTMTWEGKRLQTLTGSGLSIGYTYDEQGVRTSKTANGATTAFSYNGSLLMAQATGSGESQIKQLYSYDANGNLLSVNYNGTEYFYLRNGQSDVVGLMDGSGNKVVEYTYDSWGKLISTTGTLATTLGANNPFRYRGYYYDTETGLYYLMTRYYDPEVCRFISADVYMSTGQGILGNNMFAYCGNNPGIHMDSQGCETQIIPTWIPPESYGWLAAALGVADPALLLIGMIFTIPFLFTASSAPCATVQAMPLEQAVEKEQEIEIDITKTRRLPQDNIIYRRGGNTYQALTPRINDVSGLSFQLTQPTESGYFMTTINTINKTGILNAKQDGPNHVSVIPVDTTQLPIWIASRPSANISPHPYSILLKTICIRVK